MEKVKCWKCGSTDIDYALLRRILGKANVGDYTVCRACALRIQTKAKAQANAISDKNLMKMR